MWTREATPNKSVEDCAAGRPRLVSSVFQVWSRVVCGRGKVSLAIVDDLSRLGEGVSEALRQVRKERGLSEEKLALDAGQDFAPRLTYPSLE